MYSKNGCLYRHNLTSVATDRNYFEAIEQAVLSIGGVIACAVVPKVDSLRGNRTVCFVKSINRDCKPSGIRRHCRDLLGEAHVPKEVRLISDFPILPSGKPDLLAIEAMLLESA